MFRVACIAVSAALLLAPDVSHVLQLHPSTNGQQEVPSGESVPVLPSFGAAPNQQQAAPATDAGGSLTEESRIEIIRYVSGEFAHMVTSLPAGKQGFRIKAGDPIDHSALQKAVQSYGAAVNSGDSVQITKVEFRDHDIVLEVNGGPNGHTSWRNRVHLDTDGPVSSTVTPDDPAVPPPATGATLYLDFGQSLPNMSADDLKKYLAEVFDFSNQRSAAVQWTDTLPSKIRDAIENKQAAVGMDRDEVLAALGRPDRKVREREEDGTETEDWIYGHPPTKTIFVRFVDEKVVKVSQYPQ